MLIKINEDVNKKTGTGPKKVMTMDEKADESRGNSEKEY